MKEAAPAMLLDGKSDVLFRARRSLLFFESTTNLGRHFFFLFFSIELGLFPSDTSSPLLALLSGNVLRKLVCTRNQTKEEARGAKRA